MKMKMKMFLKPTVCTIFFVSLMAFHLWACFSKLDGGVDLFKACEVSYNCGEWANISYPFWGKERPDFCGKREMELKCKDNRRTTIEINSFEYYVLNISLWDPYSVIMRIARSDLFDNLCPQNQNENQIETATLDYSGFRYSWNDQDISIWYDCPAQEGIIPEELRFMCGWERENNSTTGSGSGRRNYALEPDAMYWSRDMSGCKKNINTTVRMGWKEGGNNRTTLLETALKQGFGVEYSTDLYSCEACKKSGGTCGGNATHFYCICASANLNYICGVAVPFGPAPAPAQLLEFSPSISVADGPAPEPSPSRSVKSNLRKKVSITVAIALGSIIMTISIIIFTYYTRKNISNKDKIDEIIKRYSTHTPKRYSYSKLKKITGSFKNKLGQGGFSIVYKGKLSNGQEVAVKLLNESEENDGQDFMNEAVSITNTAHVNIVTLLGFCYEQNKRALVYEYMPKGSLDKYIFQKGRQKKEMELDWNTLYGIVMGVARGLEYLHRGCNTRILHFDIKPHNILLDNEFCPKISDFGLAKQCKARESHVSMTGVKGTPGFMAPEVIFRNFGKVSHKSDVYSYGMLVLEIVGERKSPNEGVGESKEEYFPDWIYEDLAESEKDRNCRHWGQTEEEEELARKMVAVGLYCIQTLPNDRPSMTEVVAMLEGNVDGLQIPPKPALLRPPAASVAASSFTSYYDTGRREM